MLALPAGTVTLLFTDIESSTQLLHELGDDYGGMLAEHQQLIREACDLHGGVEVDTQGDAFFLAFPSAKAAVNAAVDAQNRLASTPARVRMGIHTGEPTIAHDRYVGLDVVLAARICAAAHGDQIVLSQATCELVHRNLRDLGEHRLKDITDPVRLYQVGDKEFPPLRSLNWTNLPLPATPLIGREREVADALELLRRQDVRLMTFIGPGGIGKTRLALELGAELVPEFDDGVLWVPLAGVSDPELVVSTVAGTVGAKRELGEHLSDRQALLALDNFEQVVEAAPAIAALLNRCPRLRVVVTSREPLHISGEREFPVPTLNEQEAISLFRERAQAVRPGFAENDEVGQICERLERLPLAIELAAARIKVLEPAEMLARLERRLPFLTSRRRDLPERQRTLRGTIEWSYDLLDPEEQRLFRYIGVFAGGTDPDAGARVCGATLEGLESLVDKSLLRYETGRFVLLETIREYALELLADSGEADELSQRHAEYFCRFAEEAELELEGSEQDLWLDRVAEELDNVRAALEWSLAGGDPALGARLASSLSRFWYVRGHGIEERRWLERALAANPEAPAWLEMKLIKSAAGNAQELRDFGRAEELTTRRLVVARAGGDEREVARCLHTLGVVAAMTADTRRAASLLRDAIALLRELGERGDLVLSLGSLSRVLAYAEKDFETAEALASEALALARERGDLEQILDMTQWMGWLRIEQGRTDLELEREVLELAHRLQSKNSFRRCCEDLAFVLARQGNLELAAQLMGKAQALREELGIPPWAPATDPLLTIANEQVRSGLTEDALLKAMNVGRVFDLRELLEATLDEAARATVIGTADPQS